MTQFSRMLETLIRHGVEFVIIGGVAATAHGSSIGTLDLDICYARDPQNLERLVQALMPLNPRLRGAPDNLPFRWDAETLRRGLNFTLMSDFGEIDLLGEVAGVGTYEKVRVDARTETVFGVTCSVMLWEAQHDEE